MSKIRIATFNLGKNEGDFPNRIYELCDNLKSKRLDVICFQEDYTSETFSSGKFLNLELDYNYVSTKTRQKVRNKKLSTSNLTILSRHKIALVDEIYFDKHGEEERACQFVEVEYYDTKILLANTHLCHLSQKRRKTQLDSIVKRLDYYPYKHRFLCGDLNAVNDSTEINWVRTQGFEDRNRFSTHSDGTILDYIFHKSNDEIFVESLVSLKGFSDHHCLLNLFNLSNDKKTR